MRNAFATVLMESAESRDDLFVITGDAGFGVFDVFGERYPDRIRNLGVAEQNAMGFAAGLALGGRKVVVYNIIPFVLYRCYACTAPGFLDTSLTISGSFGRRSRKRRTRMPQDRRGGVSPYLG